MSAAAPHLSRALAETMSAATFEKLPANVILDARRAVLDWLGSVIAGSKLPPARMVHEVVRSFGVSNEARVFGAVRSSALGAALANGVSSHILEMDDLHLGSTMHAGSPIISAALAVAERERASGRAFLLAVIVGYDAALRIGESVNPSHYRYWHPTGTAATFGAAVAAGSLLHLNTDQMLHALGTAGTQASGLWEFNADGAMSKHLHPGKAAMNGVLAADLARRGFTGASRIVEGERGFARAMSDAFDGSRITDGLGSTWKISENSYKMYSCCGHTHTAIDAVLALRADPRDIEDVLIETYGPGFEIVNNMRPETPYQAKFSMAYVCAAALLDGAVGLQQFTEDNIPGVSEFLPRIRVEVVPALTAMYPAAWPARVTIILRNGSRLLKQVDHASGTPQNPVSMEVLERKFTTLTGRGAEIVHRIEAARDIRALFDEVMG
ncbi:MAG: MmgE/PrpD family protein [Candidatus Solibacter usitatus]|nr:MmgE/PrpD family protein [Candidatus Solibacter usitatus]